MAEEPPLNKRYGALKLCCRIASGGGGRGDPQVMVYRPVSAYVFTEMGPEW